MKDKRFIEALDRLNIRDSRREELLGEILLRAEAEEREQKYMKKSRLLHSIQTNLQTNCGQVQGYLIILILLMAIEKALSHLIMRADNMMTLSKWN